MSDKWWEMGNLVDQQVDVIRSLCYGGVDATKDNSFNQLLIFISFSFKNTKANCLLVPY